jgi:predicted nicotinamide N-methyase
LASEILITDHANDAVALLQENINYLNLSNAAAKRLDWNSFPTDIKADTILLSDINYAPEQFDPLVILVNRFLKEGSTVILATPQRIMGIPFIKSLENYIKETHVHTIFEHEQPIDISILILRLF